MSLHYHESTETKTTDSVAVIAVGPSETNWFMGKKAVNDQSYLWPILPTSKGSMNVTTLPETKTKRLER